MAAGIYSIIPGCILLTIIINNNCSLNKHEEKIRLATLSLPLKIQLFYVLKDTILCLNYGTVWHDN